MDTEYFESTWQFIYSSQKSAAAGKEIKTDGIIR
mgnify:CR=1 FL=1